MRCQPLRVEWNLYCYPEQQVSIYSPFHLGQRNPVLLLFRKSEFAFAPVWTCSLSLRSFFRYDAGTWVGTHDDLSRLCWEDSRYQGSANGICFASASRTPIDTHYAHVYILILHIAWLNFSLSSSRSQPYMALHGLTWPYTALSPLASWSGWCRLRCTLHMHGTSTQGSHLRSLSSSSCWNLNIHSCIH